MNTSMETVAGPPRRTVLAASRVAVFERMLEIRALEQRIQTLYTEGLVRGSTHLCIGQEAVCTGLAAAAPASDRVTCTYRGHGMALALGTSPAAVFGEILGRANGCAGGVGGSMHLVDVETGLMPTSAIVGAGLPIACGLALSSKLSRAGDVALTVFGDGSTNIGAFHESLNLAAIWKLPVVFVCENNLYGEYTRINLSTPIEDLAERASSYAMPSEIVDGQDHDEVCAAVGRALDRARSGEGPTLLEMKTYRYSGHSRSDPATYRPEGELDAWRQRDPIALFRGRLVAAGDLDDAAADAAEARVTEEVEAAAAEAIAADWPAPEEMFRHVEGSTT
ncbi:MAG TPA: thiamine pyrophosphate-dependent dehydrogenase E1 component subunit alpha [Solirubrobacterales bacterium]|nr:thiamine pyrophosphate-dependent dehydrogenase E1 component subunit alpha [Solirubrobacterales bacterium]